MPERSSFDLDQGYAPAASEQNAGQLANQGDENQFIKKND